MKDFDYIIIGGGCAGLSLAFELELNKKPMIDEELGFCLRIIECDEKEKKIMNNI